MGRLKLRSYQEIGRDFLIEKKRAILADDTGIGKTYQTLAAIKKLGKKALLIVPKNMCNKWSDTARDAFGMTVAPVYGDSDKVKLSGLGLMGSSDITITNYGSIRSKKLKALAEGPWDIVVLDEAHYIQNRKSKRTEAAKRIFNIKCRWAEYVWLLTATPVWNKADALWSLLNALYPRRFSSFWRFVYNYCIVVKTPFATEIKGTRPEKVPELREMLVEFLLRRRKEDVLTELPECIENVIMLDPPKGLVKESVNLRKVMKSEGSISQARLHVHLLERDSFTFEEDERLYKYSMPPVKKDALRDILLNEEGNRILVLARYRDSVEIIRKWLSEFDCVDYFNDTPITGAVPEDTRAQIIKAFNTSRGTSVLLGTIKTMGTGLDLQAANVVIFLEHPDMYSELEQGIGRVSRMGAEKVQMIYHLIQKGTRDERVWKRCNDKASNSEELIG